MTRHKAAVVGLGQVGLLFDDDTKRTGIWTHCTAYERCAERFDLIAACDPDAARRDKAASRFPSIRCYASIEDMLRVESLDVVSLCSPPDRHLGQIDLLAGKVRGIICEKPIGGVGIEAASTVKRCADAGTLLAVNYYKRFDGCVPTAAQLVRSGKLGIIRSATAFYAGPLEAVGSHALDLLGFLLGPLELKFAFKTKDTRHVAVLSFDGAGIAVLQQTGPREELVFELDIVGSGGRVRILDNCDRLEYTVFDTSPRYGGYLELSAGGYPNFVPAQRFLPLFEEVADCLDGSSSTLTSNGLTALAAQTILEDILNVS
jgi:predicted dehydrogenase